MRITLTATAVIISLALAACGSKQEEAATPERIVGVTIETVAASDAEGFTEALGVVRARTVSNVAARLMATVVATPVDEGDIVKAGQLVLQLDDRDVAAQLRKAKAGLDEIENAIAGAEAAKSAADAQAELATATYERYDALRERRSVSPQEFDEVQARYRSALALQEQASRMVRRMLAKRDQASADVNAAAAALTWARIVSPIDGVVTNRAIDVGSQAMPGMPLLTIEDPGAYRVEAELPESSLGIVHSGDSATVLVDPEGRVLQGRVTHVSPALDPASRSYLVKVDLPEHQGLTTGLTARVRFASGELTALTVPAGAITSRGQLTGIWIADSQGIATLRFIQTGRALGDRVEVVSGLSAGERVVVETSSLLHEGDLVADAMPDNGSGS